MSERELVQSILVEFGALPTCRIWRANSGAATWRGKDGKTKGLVRFGVPGQADISGIMQGGMRIEIEAKTATGRQSDDQKRWQAMIEKFGGAYCLARSVDDVRMFLAGLEHA